jgi:hypothetical protein
MGTPPALVTDSVSDALAAVESGRPVVLVGSDGAALVAAVAGVDPGRLALMVGDPADAATRAAAEEMAAELWANRA